LALLGGLAWWFMGRGTAEDTKTTTTTQEVKTNATTNSSTTTKKTTTAKTSTNTHTHADGTVHSGDHSHSTTTKAGEAAAGAAANAVPEGKMEAKLMVNAAGDLVDEAGKVVYKKGEFTIGENGTFLDKDGKRIRIFLDKVKGALKGAGEKIKGAGAKVKDAVKKNN